MSETSTRETVFLEIERYWAEHYRPPTIQELANSCEVSKSVIHGHLLRLAFDKRILLKPNSRGAIPMDVVAAIDNM
jgi:hypothetical protein